MYTEIISIFLTDLSYTLFGYTQLIIMNRRYIYIIILATFFASCSQKQNTDNQRGGKIIFDISYPNHGTTNVSHTFLPNKMELLFDGANQLRYDIKSPISLYSLSFIINNDSNKCQTHLRFINKDFTYTLAPDDYFFIFEKNSEYDIIPVPGDTKTIIGFTCQKILLHNKSNHKEISAYYTKDLAIKSINLYTPYQNINGVILEFTTDFNDLQMCFSASDISTCNPSSESFVHFTKPTKKSSQQEVITLITSMLQASL